MSEAKLIIGMPAGSLADAKRGGSLINVLLKAGFHAKGYDQGGPTTFPLNTFLMGWDGRPQEFGSQLALGEVDIAIAGDDWIKERQLEFKYEFDRDIEVTKVLSLRRGQVRIVIINADDAGRPCDEWLSALLAEKPIVSMVSEMPYLAIDWFQQKIATLGFGDSHGKYCVQKFKTPPRIDSGLVVYETWGKTEAKVKNGSVDFGLEITQTGSAIRNYGLNIAEQVLESEAGVWANPALKDNPEKYDLARMFLLNMYGAIDAEHKVLVNFNCPKTQTQAIKDYLDKNSLYENEPTLSEGDDFVMFSIQLDVTAKDLTLANVRYQLAKLGATGIETIPLESSIPGLNALKF